MKLLLVTGVYLAARATTVFVWGGRNRGATRQEIIMAVKQPDSRVDVPMRLSPNRLNMHELSEISVASISILYLIIYFLINIMQKHHYLSRSLCRCNQYYSIYFILPLTSTVNFFQTPQRSQ